MRRIAILSDVHGHLQSLQAVLADAHAAGATEIVVAGDVVNFGPDSPAAVDRLRACGAQMIRGNHEVELVATYLTPQMPDFLARGVRFGLARRILDSLGAERRTFLSGLPDLLWLDEATIVAHGSPRHVRDAVTETRSAEELAAMLDGSPARLAFVGHTHRPVSRDVPPAAGGGSVPRRFVNVGSAGFNLDGDVRAAYVLAEADRSGVPGAWCIEPRRVPYDVEAAVAAYDNGPREAHPEFVELLARQLRTARSYFGPWLRSAAGLSDEEVLPSIRRFLAEHP
jgi:predicted phosphodiesterase